MITSFESRIAERMTIGLTLVSELIWGLGESQRGRSCEHPQLDQL
jgi:hypothetical protein